MTLVTIGKMAPNCLAVSLEAKFKFTDSMEKNLEPGMSWKVLKLLDFSPETSWTTWCADYCHLLNQTVREAPNENKMWQFCVLLPNMKYSQGKSHLGGYLTGTWSFSLLSSKPETVSEEPKQKCIRLMYHEQNTNNCKKCNLMQFDISCWRWIGSTYFRMTKLWTLSDLVLAWVFMYIHSTIWKQTRDWNRKTNASASNHHRATRKQCGFPA